MHQIKHLILQKEQAVANLEKEFTLLDHKIQEAIAKAGSDFEGKVDQNTGEEDGVEKATGLETVGRQGMVDLEVRHLNTIY